MNCVIPNRGIRAFGKAIQCLAKIGEELYIEALAEGLALKTVNPARSAYASFLFCPSFFHSYDDGRRAGHTEEEEEEEDTIKCKITIKSCLSVFRALATLERTVDHCRVKLDLKLSKLVFVFHCRHGIVKTHNLGFQECEALQAVFTKELCPNHIKVQSRTLSEVVVNFPSFLEEVTMAADPERVTLKNYLEEDSVDSRATLTEVCLLPGEFEDYQIGVDASITFCLKELRAVLLFTDALPQSLSVRFEGAGRPVVFSTDDSGEYQADFVLATLHDSSASCSQHQTTSSTLASHAATKGSQKISTAVHKRVESGGRRRGSNEEGLVDWEQENMLKEDGAWEQATEGTISLGRGWGRGQGRVRGKGALHQNGEGGQRSSENGGGYSHGNHVPPPPVSDPMEVEEYNPELLQRRGQGEEWSERAKERRRGGRGGGGGGEVVSRVFDPMDVLFGEENTWDVAEEGAGVGGFGMHPPAASTAETGGGGCGVRREELEEDSRNLCSTSFASSKSSVHGETRQPLSDKPSSRNRPPHLAPTTMDTGMTSVGGGATPPHLGQKEEDNCTTQDSILQDSGFLPGTPPAKKFKSSSFLFGVGMFSSDLHCPNQSEILAPDSEEDSD